MKRTSCFFFCQNQKGEPIQENTQTATKTTAVPKPQTVKQKIGKTTYVRGLYGLMAADFLLDKLKI